MSSPSDQQQCVNAALLQWLQTFPEFKQQEEGSSIEEAFSLTKSNVPQIILGITKQLTGNEDGKEEHDAAANNQQDATTSTWKRIASLLSSSSSQQEPVQIVASLLVYCVECSDRAIFIGRITALPQQVQLQLMEIIKQHKQQQSNVVAVAAQEVEMASPRRPTSSSIPTMQSPTPTTPATPQQVITALLAWLRTFTSPVIASGFNNSQALNETPVALAVLKIVEQLCSQEPSDIAYASAEDIWNAIQSIILLIAPSVQYQLETEMDATDKHILLLTALVAHAVSYNSPSRKTNIGKILTLPDAHQAVLMREIDARRSYSSPMSPQRRRSRDESTTSGYTPLRKRPSVQRMGGFFSPSTLESALERMVEELKSQNNALQNELEKSTTREADLSARITDLNNQVKKDMMKMESASIRQAEQTQEDHERALMELKRELDQLRQYKDQQEDAQSQVRTLQDQVDVMQHSSDKLAETEEKLSKCRERLEQLSNIKDALQREEEAHSKSVQQCLTMGQELKSLQPLRRQLQEYKERAVDAEVKLAECQADLTKLSTHSQTLNSAQKDLLKGAKLHQEEAEKLRQRLYVQEEDEAGPAVAEGISEMNPQIKQELTKLRHENAQLQEFVASRQDDAVQRLEEQLDDAQRLSERFKKQFLETKQELESTQTSLSETESQVVQLNQVVQEWTTKWTSLQEEAQQLQIELEFTKTQLNETQHTLEESKAHGMELEQELTQANERHADLEAEYQGQSREMCQTQQQLDETKMSLQEATTREAQLASDVAELTTQVQNQQQHGTQLETELVHTQSDLAQTRASLEEIQEKSSVLQEQLHAKNQALEVVEQRLQQEEERHAEAVLSMQQHSNTEQRELESKHEQEKQTLQEALDKTLEKERFEHQSKMEAMLEEHRQTTESHTTKYHALEQQTASQLGQATAEFETQMAQLKSDFTQELQDMKKQAEDAREGLIQKGKTMMNESKRKHRDHTTNLEQQLAEIKESLEDLQQEKEALEQKIRSKIISYKQRIQFATNRNTELTEENDKLNESIRVGQREQAKVLEENERFRRQLGGRYGADGKNQSQLEVLQREFNVVLEENRALKKRNATQGGSLGVIAESSASTDYDIGRGYASVSGSTLSAFREEYEEHIQALKDEKRELIMKNSAAITDVQKAEQRSWELQKKVERLNEELVSSNLALQRAELQQEESRMNTSTSHDQSFHSAQESEPVETPMMVHNKSVFSPSNRKPSQGLVSVTHKPSLVDVTQPRPTEMDEGQQECKQS